MESNASKTTKDEYRMMDNNKNGGISMMKRISPWHFVALFFAIVYGSAMNRNMKFARDPLIYMIPNTLLYTPFRSLTHKAWGWVLRYDTNKEIPLIPIPELSAEEYSYDKLKEITQNFRYPAVVRGLFRNTTAVQRWHTRDHVAKHIGDYEVAFLQEGSAQGLEDDRVAHYIPFRDAWNEVLDDASSRKYLFFPEMSRLKKGNETQLFQMQGLKTDLNRMVRSDLGLDRLWRGFASEHHTTYVGTQFIAGWGQDSLDDTTGSNWHCAPGNNWFIQVHGIKRWLFVDTVHSAYMYPQRDGISTMATSSREMISKYEKYLPVKYVDMQPGDLVYNPDFEWHAIRNHKGLSIGIPIREFNKTLCMANNQQYTLLIGINRMLASYGITYGLQSHLKK